MLKMNTVKTMKLAKKGDIYSYTGNYYLITDERLVDDEFLYYMLFSDGSEGWNLIMGDKFITDIFREEV